MGARLAFEITRELARIGAPPPRRLYVGAAHPPHLPEPLARLAHATEDEFVDQLISRAGAPAAIREDPDVRAALMPVVRTDLDWLQQYRYHYGPPLTTPVIAFAGTHDREVSADVMLGWARHTTGSFKLHTLVGDHLFLTSAAPELVSLIGADLAAAMGENDQTALPMPAVGEVHVWLALLDRLPGAGAAVGELPPRVAAKAAMIEPARDRRRYLGRRVLLRRLLRRYGGPPGVRISLGHCEGTMLVAVSRTNQIGIDVERVRPTADLTARCGSALTGAERAVVAAEPEEDQLRAGLRFCTAKRAVLKATGAGARMRPDQFSFAGAAHSGDGWWRPDPDPAPGALADSRVIHLEVGGAVAALAAPHDGWRLRFETIVEDRS